MSKSAHSRTTQLDVTKVELSNWRDIHKHSETRWIFRGMNDSTLPLETALERNGWNHDCDPLNLRERESKLLREFQRRYHHYSQHCPLTDDTLEWLSIMQHHGAPTRLLDWSYSIYVAAYFALEEETEHDCAVWAINIDWLFGELKKLYRGKNEMEFLTEPIQDTPDHRSLFKKLFIDNLDKIPFVASFAPFRMNERLTIQKGTFLVPGDLSRTLEQNLSAMPGHKEGNNIKKLVIPKGERKVAIESLFYMNISRATLFPGLDGFSTSLDIYHPTLDSVKDPAVST